MAYNVATLARVGKLATRSVKDATQLKSLLVEAGCFEDDSLVDSLVQHRALEIDRLLKSESHFAEPSTDNVMESISFGKHFHLNGHV